MNDAGKVAFTPKGDYSSTVTYEYLDTVVYDGNAYAALKTTTGNQPEDDSEYWALLARGGTSIPTATEDTQGAVKASDDIGVDSNAKMVLKTDFTEQTNLTEIQSGETRKTFLGKIAKAVSDFISHVEKKATSSTLGHVKLSRTSSVTQKGEYALDATEKNASIDGTLANQIATMLKGLAPTSIDDATYNAKWAKYLTDAEHAYTAADIKTNIDSVKTLNGGGNTGQTGEAMRLMGKSDSNCVYGSYNFGIYFIAGSESGLPLTGYAGFLVTLRWTTSRIVKILFLVNAYTYVMSQENNGTVVSSWVQL